jgi:MFS family permease
VGLPRDLGLLFLTAALRNLAFGCVAVFLALYLAGLSLGGEQIGAIFTVALIGSAATTVSMAGLADGWGRRRTLVAGALLMAASGALFALARQPWLLFVAAALGAVSPSGKEVGPTSSVEQAILAQQAEPSRRTALFAWYNLISSGATAAGSLLAALPQALGSAPEEGYRILWWAYCGGGLLLALLFGCLSEAAEAPGSGPCPAPGLGPSRGRILALAGLFGVDAFAGGFIVQSMVAWWFHLRFGIDLAGLGGIFFGANLLAALSFLAAAPVARRIGLLNTMVWTHLPSNLLLALVPLAPTAGLAVGLLLARYLLCQLDVPTRQSYLMAVVDPRERSAAAGVTSVARHLAASLSPALAGWALQAGWWSAPFFLAGGLKVLYDLILWATFRGLRPPEEAAGG